ncbi:FAD-dependent oxidoreductase, partial [Marmoricola endophyticus]|uniref:FAD-dependent oxidoreductase n=1 Tax=Marmoricola endophyticus TaxID=2040280 RepID=UPI0016647F7B
MAFVILQNCCKDASCVAACPVNCIHPVPGEDGDYDTAPMLYVDPRVCIDCGACADACPVDAVVPADTLSGPELAYAEINAEHYAGTPLEASGLRPDRPTFRDWGRPSFDWSLPSDFAPLHVAVVGTGPAGMYAAEHLLLHTASRVTLIDRLPVAGGLVRYGVAPDHPGTKRIGDTFARLYSHPRVRMLLGVEVGTDVSFAEIGEHVDAVVVATGASEGRRLGVPGEDLGGSLSGPEFVGWYNGHPDVPADAVRLDRERAVLVGTGNVALDIARILSVDPEVLAGTDLADHALAARLESAVREVVVLSRRGPEHAAYTAPELRALSHLAGVELVVDDHDGAAGATIDAAAPGDHAALLQGVPRRTVDVSGAPAPGRRIVLRFGAEVAEAVGSAGPDGAARVEEVVLRDGTRVPAGLLVTSIGYRGRPIQGLPYDDERGTVPNEHGRVDGAAATYVVGWAKRGSSGGIGDNRTDAAATVRTLLDDAVAGRLGPRKRSTRALGRAVRRARPDVLDAKDLARIERTERAAGTAQGRPRVKLTTTADLR